MSQKQPRLTAQIVAQENLLSGDIAGSSLVLTAVDAAALFHKAPRTWRTWDSTGRVSAPHSHWAHHLLAAGRTSGLGRCRLPRPRNVGTMPIVTFVQAIPKILLKIMGDVGLQSFAPRGHCDRVDKPWFFRKIGAKHGKPVQEARDDRQSDDGQERENEVQEMVGAVQRRPRPLKASALGNRQARRPGETQRSGKKGRAGDGGLGRSHRRTAETADAQTCGRVPRLPRESQHYRETDRGNGPQAAEDDRPLQVATDWRHFCQRRCGIFGELASRGFERPRPTTIT